MSGTSLDGISAAAVRFRADGGRGYTPELLAYTVTPYTSEQRDRLHAAMTGGTARELCRLAFDFGDWLATAAASVIGESGVARSDVRAIGSHGQTLWHEPGHSTWQFGESAVIAERLGIDVVDDFRVRDVAAAGQGAPLVPIADALLFASADWRLLQNIGGIGNVTVVPAGGDPATVRAFDTGPGVAVIDAVVRQLVPALPYDEDGRLALAGSPVESVVETLLRHAYFAAEPPKSTGRELFDAAYVQRLIEDCRRARPDATNEDIVATATSLTARSIADAYRRFIPEPVTEVLVSGGGAKNPAITGELAQRIAPIAVRAFDEVYFDGEAKEAVAFALLALLHVERRPGNVLGATGARGERILGKLTPA
ncbi:MAG: anhydro-N-acetylmuramic acid kinase [Gemmatimonadaceae bacterium]|nr:anhydro-N-acetylmuramic acid kinase [Gemmatimonadaceae bacterium]